MILAAVLTVKNDKPYRHILHYNAFSCHDEAEQQRQFEKLSDASRRIYENSTSWKAWTIHFKKFIDANYAK